MPSSLIGQCSQLCWLSTSTSSTTTAAGLRIGAGEMLILVMMMVAPNTSNQSTHPTFGKVSQSRSLRKPLLGPSPGWKEEKVSKEFFAVFHITCAAQRNSKSPIYCHHMNTTVYRINVLFISIRYNFIPIWFIIGCKICKYRQFVW